MKLYRLHYTSNILKILYSPNILVYCVPFYSYVLYTIKASEYVLVTTLSLHYISIMCLFSPLIYITLTLTSSECVIYILIFPQNKDIHIFILRQFAGILEC